MAQIRSLLDAASLPEVLEEPVERRLRQLLDFNPEALDSQDFSTDDADTFVQLVASSEFAGGVVVRNWSWFTEAHASQAFREPVSDALLGDFVARSRESSLSVDEFKKELRRFRNRCLVHVLWRCLAGQDDLWASLGALSNLADTMILAALHHAAASNHVRPPVGEKKRSGPVPAPLE